MNIIKKSIISITAVCMLIIATALPVFGYAQSNDSVNTATSALLVPPSSLPVMEKYFGYDCKLTYSENQNWLHAINSITVNSTKYNRVDNSFGVWNDTDYYVDSSYILIGEQAMTQSCNIVIISAYGYSDLIYEINKSRTDIAIHQHSGGAATCKDLAKCTKCGQSYGELDSNHSFDQWEISAAPSCVDDGTEQRICTICGFTETQKVSATGHTEIIKNAKDATCTEEGYTGDTVCQVCGKIIENGFVIPKLAHSYVNGECVLCGLKAPENPTEATISDNTDNNDISTNENNNSNVTTNIADQNSSETVKDNPETDSQTTVDSAKNNSETDSQTTVESAKDNSQKSPSTGNNFNYAFAIAFIIAGTVTLMIFAVTKSINKRKSKV